MRIIRNVLAASLICVLVFPSSEALCFSREKFPLRVAVVPVLNQLPFVVSHQNDRLSFQTVDYQLSTYNSYTSAEAALRVGAVDVASLPAPLVFQMAADEVDFKIIGTIHSGGSRLLVAGSGDFLSLQDRLIGVPGLDSCENLDLAQTLKEAGFAYGLDYKAIRVPLDTALEDLRGHKISAVYLPEPFPSFAESENLAGMISEGDKFMMRCESLLVVRTEVLEKAPEPFRQWLKSLINACRYIEKDLTATGARQCAIFQAPIFGYPKKLVARVLSSRMGGLRFDNFLLEPTHLNEIITILMRFRLLETSVNLERFLDLSLMKQVIEEGAGK